LQDVIFAGTWQGTRLVAGGRWALLTCVVVPGFAWDAFELGDRDVLSARYVALTQDIAALSRPNRVKGMR
jgi:predicted cupin superfamily sugar epimerase